MLYTIGFVTRQQSRDLQLDKILDSNFDEKSYIHVGDYSFLGRVGTSHVDVWNSDDKYYGPKAIVNCSKWKTIKGAQNAIERVKLATNKFRMSVRTRGDIWRTAEYVPIICEISNKWNSYINKKIDEESKSYEKRIKLLRSKLN